MRIGDSKLLRSDFWLDIFFPNRCPCCDRLIVWDKLICDNCGNKLPYLKDKPIRLTNGGDDISSVICAFEYKDLAKQGIISLKKGYGRNFARLAAPILAEGLEREGISADIITAVPMSKRKKKQRGCNQSEVIAEELGKLIGIPCDHKILKRSNASLEQHSLNAEERSQAASEMYFMSEKAPNIRGKRIILCDDVITTGATVSRCAKLLRSAGAAEVVCVSVCYTKVKK